jgi:calcium-translocating P-type ATPase
MPNVKFYTQSVNTVLNALGTNEQGLSPEEVNIRIQKYGMNVLPEQRVASWIKILLTQFKSPLIYLLLIAAGITIWLQEWTDTTVILLSVVVNTGIGFYQEFHSGNIFKSLKKTIKTIGFVLRGNTIIEIEAQHLVPGDVVMLRSGEKVPADTRIIEARELEINESLLTGESEPVAKSVDPLTHETDLAEQKNMAFMGTVIEHGQGKAVVVHTGINTEIGRITRLTKTIKEDKTPLQKRIIKLGKILVLISTIAIIFIFIEGIIKGKGVAEMLTTSVAIAVAAIPEGLPAAITVVLAVSASRIFKQKGLIRKLIAAETLGSTSVICTDKTGTLTEGKMKVESVICANPSSEWKVNSLYALGLANEAIIEKTPAGEERIKGDTTDQAKLHYVREINKEFNQFIEEHPRIALLPFDANKLYIASFHPYEGKIRIFVSGAPEVLIHTSDSSTDKGKYGAENEALAKRGFRVIAIAYRDIEAYEITGKESPEKLRAYITNLTFLGLAAIRDPIRHDVPETLQTTRKAGIRVVLVTGDNLLTAQAIGKELGFAVYPGAVMEGKTLDTISNEELENRIQNIDIFARVTPAHKLRIITAWQKRGESVAMTGDGVNDAPSLKAADIGLALGNGTEVAKEASELVLLDDGFPTITTAIRQGRIAFDNIRKVVIFLLNGTFTEILIIAGALLANLPLPLTAIQILWINLVEDGFPNFALAFEPGNENIMDRPPLKKNEPILNKTAIGIIFFAGLLSDIALIGLFFWLNSAYAITLIQMQTIFFLAVGTDALLNIFPLKSLHKPLLRINIFNNKYLIFAVMLGLTLQVLAVYTPFLNSFLGTTPLGFHLLLIPVGYLLLRTFLIEIVKWRYYKVV